MNRWQIRKYTLPIHGDFELRTWVGTTILSAAWQGNNICLWVNELIQEYQVGHKQCIVKFKTVFTGEEYALDIYPHSTFIGTCVSESQDFVVHVYCTGEYPA